MSGHRMPTVLVGVDGSNNALRAVRWAAAEAHRRMLPLRLVHAFALVAEPDFPAMPSGGESYRDLLLEQARGYLLLGSVSNALMHKAACPVALVRPEFATSEPADRR